MTSRALRFDAHVIAGLMVVLAVHAARAEDTVESLLRDPKRLDAVQAGCKTNARWTTDALCKSASQALRRRFFGGGVHYAPQHVEPFPSQPNSAPTSPEGNPHGANPQADAPATPR